eukprot:4945146-Alexandrium_andersonii.AAC.1
MRAALVATVPHLAAPTSWCQTRPSQVEQPGAEPHRKDRGAEQGDVYGPIRCGVSMAELNADTRDAMLVEQAAGILPWT